MYISDIILRAKYNVQVKKGFLYTRKDININNRT